MIHSQLTQLPEASQLIAFDRVQIVMLHGAPVLTVSGTKPYVNMEVRLEPRVYMQQPEYWAIEVIGRLPGGIGLPVVTPYTVSLPLTGIVGTRGIEIVGANRSERRDLWPGTQPNVFELRGDGTGLRLRNGVKPADRELCYRDGERERRFRGAEIGAVHSGPGQLLTGELEPSHLKLTLVVPGVNLGGTREQPVATHAVLTTQRRADAVGQQTSSAIVALSGSAQLERMGS